MRIALLTATLLAASSAVAAAAHRPASSLGPLQTNRAFTLQFQGIDRLALQNDLPSLLAVGLWPGDLSSPPIHASLLWSSATRLDSPETRASARRRDPSLFDSPAPHGSDLSCVAELLGADVEFELSGPVNGIATPVSLRSWEIGGIEYVDYFDEQRNRHIDCRLALALARLGPVLKNVGVTHVIWSSAHRPLLDPSHPPPEGYDKHSQGLAIDIHGFIFEGGVRVSVADHYEKGLGYQRDSCCLGRPLTRQGLLLRLVVCRMDESDLFQEILTPDYDAGHWNHLHVATFHPLDEWRRRHKQTALLEVGIERIPGWAIRRPVRSRPSRRLWELAAVKPWPRGYEWLREELRERALARARRTASLEEGRQLGVDETPKKLEIPLDRVAERALTALARVFHLSI